jgi:1A family penicillin-binding protein
LLSHAVVDSPVLTAAQAKVRAYARGVATFCQRHRRAVTGLAIVAASAAAASGYFLWRIASEASATAASFTLNTGPQATILYDINDRQVFTLFTERRVDVPLARVSPHLIAAVLSAEDRRFYQHRGYDLVRLAGSSIANLRARRIVQGGSTITQQLVRMTNGDRGKTVSRKLREMLTAAALERRYSKASILETYLNKVYLGEGFYGVEAAAYGYFRKPASEVTPEEAATIAALIQSPTRYTRQDLTSRVRARRNWILETMHREGRIDTASYRAAADSPLWMNASTSTSGSASDVASAAAKDPCSRSTTSIIGVTKAKNAEQRDCVVGTGLYFKEAVRRELTALLPGSEVLSGGLRVYTTIDPEMQAAAEKALTDRLEAIEGTERTAGRKGTQPPACTDDLAKKDLTRPACGEKAGVSGLTGAAIATNAANATQPPPLQGSIVAIDPRTGYVKALVGGRSFVESPFDRARQARRQPGSAFKPFVYASALEAGYAPGTMLRDLDQPVEAPEGPYLPRGEHEASEMTVRRALTLSSNRAAVHMLQHVGMSSVLSYAQRFGIESPLPAVPSLALGTGEVTLVELTSAYAVFANKGEHVEPTLIRRVESASGEVLYRARSATRHVVSEDTAYLITHMLSDVITRGTATNVRRLGFTAPAAGKTGTTDRVADAWFVGYTPCLAAGVWIGYDDPRVIRKDAFASAIAVPVWALFMKAATQAQKGQKGQKGPNGPNGPNGQKEQPEQFEIPPGLEKVAYCLISGEPAGPYCQLAQEARVRNAIVVTTDPVTGIPMATNVATARVESPAPTLYYDLARPSDTTQRCSVHVNWGAPDGSPTYRAAESQTTARPATTYPSSGYQPSMYQSPAHQSTGYQAPSYQTRMDETRTYRTTPAPATTASPTTAAPVTGATPTSTDYMRVAAPAPSVASENSCRSIPAPPTAPAAKQNIRGTDRTYRVPSYGAATPGVTVGAPSTGASGAIPAPPLVSPDGRTTVVVQSNGVTRVVVKSPGTASTVPVPPAPRMSPADAAKVIRRP